MAAKKRLDPVAIEEDAVLNFQFSLIDAMAEAGLTKADLAKALGVSRARVSQMLVSEANPTIKVIARAMAALGRSVQYPPLEASSKHKDNRAAARFDLGELVAVARASDSGWAVQQHKRMPANENRYYPQLRKAAA